MTIRRSTADLDAEDRMRGHSAGKNARPLRAVTSAEPRAGRGGLLGGDTSRRKFWWLLRLDCGHTVERDMRYRRLLAGERPIRGGRTNRPPTDRLDPPKRARCDTCVTPSVNAVEKTGETSPAESQPENDRIAGHVMSCHTQRDREDWTCTCPTPPARGER